MALFLDLVMESFKKIAAQPKVVAANLLQLIPAALFFGVLLWLFGSLISTLNISIEDLFLSPETVAPKVASQLDNIFSFFLFTALLFGAAVLAVVVVSIIVGALVNGTMLESARQARGGSVSLAGAFEVAKSKTIPLVTTSLVVALLFLGLVVGVLVLSIVPILGTIVGFVLLAYVALRLYVVNAVVVFEGLSGVDAVKRSWAITQGSVWTVAGVLFTVGFSSVILSSVLNLVPVAGQLMDSLLQLLFFPTLTAFSAAEFYFSKAK